MLNSEPMAKTAIILGASGATGSELLKLLLHDDRYSKIKLFSRRPGLVNHPKIEEHIVNLFELENYSSDFTGDEVFCCIGTTKAKTPDRREYYETDFGIPANAALMSLKNHIHTYIVISAVGADADSGIFYNRIKGEMQDAVMGISIPSVHVLQPSLIVAERRENRLLEKLAALIMWLVNPLLFGNAAKYKSIKAYDVAKTMLWLANNEYPATIIPSDKIQQIAELTQ
jgi:uncharacterized protein YbjT (DUF2867 family)